MPNQWTRRGTSASLRNLINSTFQQIFRFQFFHADLHPGNLLALPGNVIGYVDFGLCDKLEDQIRTSQLRYLAAVYTGNREAMFKALTEILISGPDTDMEAFRRDFETCTREFDARQGADGSASTDRSPFSKYLIGLMQAARRNQLQVPARVLSLYRAILTVELVARQLGLGDGVRRVGQDFFLRLQRDEMIDELFDKEQYLQQFASLLNLARDGPRQIQQILTEVADGSYTLKVYVSEASRTSRTQNQRARLVTSAILTVGIAFLLRQPEMPQVFGVSLTWLLLSALGLLLVLIANLWRRLS